MVESDEGDDGGGDGDEVMSDEGDDKSESSEVMLNILSL